MSKMTSVKRRLDFGTSECSFLFFPDIVPLDSPKQDPLPKIPENLTKEKRRIFVAKQIEVLESAFDIDQYPSRARYQALALSLGVNIKKVQTWFKNARSKKRQMIRFQKMAYDEQQMLQRWRRRAELRRSINGTPAAMTTDQSFALGSTNPDPFHVPQDFVLPEQIFTENSQTIQEANRDTVRQNLFPPQVQPVLQTPNMVPATPDLRPPWERYAPVQDFPPNLLPGRDENVVPQSTSELFSTSLRMLITPSDIFNCMAFDQRLV